MENAEAKSKVKTTARQAAESAGKLGDRLRTIARDAAGSSGRWARRSGEAISEGAGAASLQVKREMARRKRDRTYRELGRAVYAAHEKGEDGGSIAENPEVRAALEQVEEATRQLQ